MKFILQHSSFALQF